MISIQCSSWNIGSPNNSFLRSDHQGDAEGQEFSIVSLSHERLGYEGDSLNTKRFNAILCDAQGFFVTCHYLHNHHHHHVHTEKLVVVFVSMNTSKGRKLTMVKDAKVSLLLTSNHHHSHGEDLLSISGGCDVAEANAGKTGHSEI